MPKQFSAVRFSFTLLCALTLDAFFFRLRKLTKQGKNSLMLRRFRHHSFLVLKTEKRKRLSYPFRNSRWVYSCITMSLIFSLSSNWITYMRNLCSNLTKSSLGACSTWIIHFQEFAFFLNCICFDQGSSSISSADLFGRNNVDDSNVDISAADLINRISFQVAFCKILAHSVASWIFIY